MADTRTLKLSLLADVNKFLAGMDKADKGTKTFKDKIGGYSKAMAKSFAIAGAAAGAYAIKLGVDGVKSAVEDELSQKKLATALRNTTKATDQQIASTEDYIKKQQLSFGIADTKLRPALANLARATGDLTRAQQLNNLAIDIAAATGRDLEGVSLGLAKAYGGNFTALKKLGIPLDENIVKTKDFDALTKQLTDTFGGSAKANTETFAGQLAILQEYFGEIQEDIGAKLIPKLKLLLENVVLVAKGFSGEDKDGLSARARELQDYTGNTGPSSLGGSLKSLADSFGTLFAALSGSDATEGNDTLTNFAEALENVAEGINAVAGAYGKLDKFTKSKGYQATLDAIFGTREGGFSTSVLNPFGTNFLGAGGITGSRAAGGSVMGGQPYRVGEFGPEMFVPSSSGSIRPAGNGSGVTIVMNGVIDGESARRSIERLLQDSSRRTGAINLVGATL
jgi:hypothetical protein